ncbi:MAG: hypothetical protein IJV04_04875 [Lachnospiraceae bacterium]|nr:hypothetical protein [Lachnospiraceae bacterium]
MEIRRRRMTPGEMAALENAEAQAVKNAANIDYIAMMADVEIPTEEEGGNDESEI